MSFLIITKFYEKYKLYKDNMFNLLTVISVFALIFFFYAVFDFTETATNELFLFEIYKKILYIPIVIAAWRFKLKYSLLLTTAICLWEINMFYQVEKSAFMAHSLLVSLPMYYFISLAVGLLNRKTSELNEVYGQLQKNSEEMIDAMVKALEAKDIYTQGHSERVFKLTSLLADKMRLPAREADDVRIAARLHDIGKIGVKDAVLNKPERLTEEEFAVIKQHPVIGAQILGKIREFERLVPIVYHHHERYDGKGYPEGRKGEEIPLGARIIAVVDSFDAMISKRAYREPYPVPQAVSELVKNADKQFEGRIVHAFVEVLKDVGLE